MEISPTWEVIVCAATEEVSNILRYLKVYHCVHKSPLLVSTLNQVSPVHITASYEIFILISIHLHLGLPSGFFPSGFPINNLYAFLFAIVHAICPAHHIHHDLIILTVLREQYNLWSSLLCSFLQPPVTSSLFGPNILLSTLFSNTLSLRSSFNVRNQLVESWMATKTKSFVFYVTICNCVSLCLMDNRSYLANVDLANKINMITIMISIALGKDS
jgi:hypothetical protein